MAKKKGKKGKGRKKKKQKDPGLTPEQIAEMEEVLQENLVKVTEEIEGIKTNIEDLKSENLRLQEQASTLKSDTQAYVNEMRARSERRQAILQGISLLKQKQLTSLTHQRAENQSSYEKQRTQLQQDITSRTQELALAQKQLQDLEPVRRLQHEQCEKIEHLESKLATEKDSCDFHVLEMKRKLIKLKYSLTEELQRELDDVKERASGVAQHCLESYVNRVRDENCQLRGQLKELIDDNRRLEAEHQRQSHIRNEQQRERDYRADIIRRLEHKLLHD